LPLTGESPFGDSVATFPVEQRDDASTSALRPTRAWNDDQRRDRTDARQLGRTPRVRMVGHSTWAGRCATPTGEQRQPEYIGIRHEGALRSPPQLTGSSLVSRRVPYDRGLGDEPAHRAVGREVDRSPVIALTGQVDTQVLVQGLPGGRPAGSLRIGGGLQSDGATDQPPRRARQSGAKNAILRRDVAHLIFPDEVQTLPAAEQPSGQRAGSQTTDRATPGVAASRNRAADACQAAGDHRRARARFDMEEITALASTSARR